jgi:uncharacterized cupin superfamily protein
LHVTPTELRVVRRGDLLLRFAMLDRVAYVLAELPGTGTAGTSLEDPCQEPHWGIVLRGDVELERDGQRQALSAGTAFHVPAGEPAHRFFATGRAVFAGFVPIDRVPDGYVDHLDEHGYQTVTNGGRAPGPGFGTVAMMSGIGSVRAGLGRVEAEAALMGDWVVCRATFGETTGYGSPWCDLPHWGMVITGGVAIEWENDVEVLSAGDVYACQAGPPGHHLEVADGATVIDFTPRDAFATTDRIADWRPRLPILEKAQAKVAPSQR